MRKAIIYMTLAILAAPACFAQSETERNLQQTISFLASDQLNGRKVGTADAEKAAGYLKGELRKMGLQVQDYSLTQRQYEDKVNAVQKRREEDFKKLFGEEYLNSTGDTLELTDASGKDSVYESFFVLIPAAKGNGETHLICANYTGSGTDTLQGKVLIRNGAAEAGGAATLLELARFFNGKRNELKRDVALLFSGCPEQDGMMEVFKDDHADMHIAFKIRLNDNLAPELNNNKTSQQGEKADTVAGVQAALYYAVSTDIANASNVLSPILMKDVDSESSAYYDVDDMISWMGIEDNSGVIYPGVYTNTASTINYPLMAKDLEQLEEVLVAFNAAELERNLVKDKDGNVLDLPYVSDDEDFFYNQYKHDSYFGIRLLAGSDCHIYHFGNITGRPTFAYGAGAFYRWQFAKYFALRLDANYEHVSPRGHYGRVQGDVLSVPLTFLFTTGGKQGSELFIGLGAYVDYYFKMNQNKVDQVALSNEFRTTLIGSQVVFGLRLDRFVIEYICKESFSNVLKNGDNRITNIGNYFSLGFRF